jgi:hypothetical protein
MLPGRADLLEILRLRLLICRAGSTDSLRWWEDASLTEDGAFLLRRLFPRSARAAARRLALQAVLLRHEVALAELPRPRHLFDLGTEVEAVLQEVPLEEQDMPDSPILDIEALLAQIGHGARRAEERPGGVLPVAVRPDAASLRQQALVLAAAYTAGRPGEPVFPVLAEGSEA